MDPQEMRWKVTAEDIMDADKRVSCRRAFLICWQLSGRGLVFAPYNLEFVKTVGGALTPSVNG